MTKTVQDLGDLITRYREDISWETYQLDTCSIRTGLVMHLYLNKNGKNVKSKARQNCISALSSQEHFNISDQDEVKTSVEQSIQRFLDVAKQMECFFLQKRLLFSVHVPEYVIKEDIQELRNELQRKEMLIQRNQDKLQNWQTMLNSQRAGHGQGAGPGTVPPPTQQGHPHPQQQLTGHPMQVTQAPQGHSPGSQQVAPQTQMQTMPPPTAQNPYPQGPLAYLEQTTSNIGLPERR